ncbi:hypothetical protein KR222_003572 [Zaprionus bogoriensis]|nr:hypothetical protein KR222_003572 [Zaprionus bogoriensis]
MTVTYTSAVTTSRRISNFLRLLGRWRGSIYKIIWMDLILFILIYVMLAVSYRVLMNDALRCMFELVVSYCRTYGTIIPLSFVLGFYVSIVMERWWSQYLTIPWPDAIAILVSASIHGLDDRARAMRRSIMRYVCLCQTIVFTMISPSVKKRFPTYTQIIEAGLMQESEKNIIEALDVAFPYYPKHWMPIVWAASIVTRARRENKIRDDYAVKSIIDELNRFRGSSGFLLYYDWVSVPLVYTQVVTLATYTFFLCNVIGQQWVDIPTDKTYDNIIDRYFPILVVLQFFTFMGWLKVAETLINPFGDDDDDFELNWMIDRNLTVCYIIVDEMHQDFPQLAKDQYWDEVMPSELPMGDEPRRYAPEASTARLLPPQIPSKLVPSVKVLYVGVWLKFKFQSIKLFLNLPDSISFKIPLIVNLEELIEQRKKERRERLRNRFLHMRAQQRPTSNSRYILTVLRPPSNRPSQQSIGEEEEEQEVSVSSKKQEKTD